MSYSTTTARSPSLSRDKMLNMLKMFAVNCFGTAAGIILARIVWAVATGEIR